MRLVFKLKLRFLLVVVCLFAASLGAPESTAQNSKDLRSIEVEGTGNAYAKPDAFVLKGFLSSNDKSAKKVLGKHLKTKESLEETINPMDFPGVEIDHEGSILKPNVASPTVFMAGGGGRAAAEGFLLSQPIKIQIEIEDDDSETSILRKVSNLVDSAETVGVSFSKAANPMMGALGVSSESVALGVLKDSSKLNQEATDAAFAQAKKKAEQLAKLAGGKLGKVISIHESSLSEPTGPTAAYMKMFTSSPSDSSAGSIDKIKATRTLRVQFELTD